MTSDSAVGTEEQLVRSAVRRAGRRLVPLLMLLPSVLGLVAMVVWTRRATNPTVRVAVTICACGVLAALPAFWALPTAYLTGATAAAGIGLVNSLGNLSGFLAPYGTGTLADATGSSRVGLWLVGACMLSAAAVTWALRRTRG